MEKYIEAFVHSFFGSLSWTWRSMLFEVPWYINFFWGLTLISLIVWGVELLFPWRKTQNFFRKDFWLDGFYMYFNFFLFSIIIGGFYKILGLLFNDFGVTIKSITLLDITLLPSWLQLLVFFVLLDFVQWFTHVLLHKYDFLWKFHEYIIL